MGRRREQLFLQIIGVMHSPCHALGGPRCRFGAERCRGDAKGHPWRWQHAMKPVEVPLRFWGDVWDSVFPTSKPGVSGQEADLFQVVTTFLGCFLGGGKKRQGDLFIWQQVGTTTTAFPCKSEGSCLQKAPSPASPSTRDVRGICSAPALTLPWFSMQPQPKSASPFPRLPPEPL